MGEFKVGMHQRFMREWVARTMQQRSWEQVWKIREECIAALTEPR